MSHINWAKTLFKLINIDQKKIENVFFSDELGLLNLGGASF